MAEDQNETLIRIRSVAELKAFEDYKKALLEAKKSTEAVGKDATKLKTEIEKVDKALKSEAVQAIRLKDSLDKVNQAQKNLIQSSPQVAAAVKKTGDAMQGVQRESDNWLASAARKFPRLIGWAALLGGAWKTARASLSEYAQEQERAFQNDAALAAQGQLTDEYREKLHALADQFEAVTAIADDRWLGVLTRLTQFGATPENIDKYMVSVKNLAGIMGGDIERAGEIFSRVLQGDTEMLRRYGIIVEDAGSRTEKVERVMELLARRGGGQLEARAESMTGQWDSMKNSLNDLLEQFGRMMNTGGVLTKIMGAMSTAAQFWADALGPAQEKTKGMTNALEASKPAFESAEAAASHYKEEQAELARQAQAVTIALQNQLEAMKDVERRQIERVNAQQALAQARIDKLEKTGKVSPEQAVRLREASRTSFAQAEANVRQSGVRREIGARQDALGREQGVLDDAQMKLEQAQALAVRAKEWEATRAALNDSGQRIQAAIEDSAAERQLVEEADAAIAAGRRPISPNIAKTRADLKSKDQNIQGMMARHSVLAEREFALRNSIPIGTSAAAAEREAKEQEKALVEVSKKSYETMEKLVQEINKLNEELRHIREIGKIEGQTRKIESGLNVLGKRDEVRTRTNQEMQQAIEQGRPLPTNSVPTSLQPRDFNEFFPTNAPGKLRAENIQSAGESVSEALAHLEQATVAAFMANRVEINAIARRMENMENSRTYSERS
jgi:hypothetical protein